MQYPATSVEDLFNDRDQSKDKGEDVDHYKDSLPIGVSLRKVIFHKSIQFIVERENSSRHFIIQQKYITYGESGS